RKATGSVFLPPITAYSPVPEKQARLAGALRGSRPQIPLPALHSPPSRHETCETAASARQPRPREVLRWPGLSRAPTHSHPQVRLLKSVALKLPCCFLREYSQFP